jgi:hypothetical protein
MDFRTEADQIKTTVHAEIDQYSLSPCHAVALVIYKIFFPVKSFRLEKSSSTTLCSACFLRNLISALV